MFAVSYHTAAVWLTHKTKSNTPHLTDRTAELISLHVSLFTHDAVRFYHSNKGAVSFFAPTSIPPTCRKELLTWAAGVGVTVKINECTRAVSGTEMVVE